MNQTTTLCLTLKQPCTLRDLHWMSETLSSYLAGNSEVDIQPLNLEERAGWGPIRSYRLQCTFDGAPSSSFLNWLNTVELPTSWSLTTLSSSFNGLSDADST